MKLIIAEKPSLGRNIAGSIGAKSRGDGFLFGDDYIVTWVFGHLFSLADIEHYNPNPDGTNRWSLKNIPCFPERFVFELKRDSATKQVDSGVIKQLKQ